jgi:predicted nucleotidyltransferase
MNCGLSDEVQARLRSVFARFPDVEKAILYGSRAKGSHKPGSDIDLTLHGQGLDGLLLGQIERELDDLLLPCRIDLSAFSHISHAGLLDHIARVGQVLYERNPAAAPAVHRGVVPTASLKA